jgi:integrase
MTYGNHLRRSRHGTLHFRLVIPADVRAIFGKSEVSISLGTSSRRSAELLTLELCLAAKRLIEAARYATPMDAPEEKRSNLRALHALVQRRKVDVLVGELHEADEVIAEKDAALTRQSARIEALTEKLLASTHVPAPSLTPVTAPATLAAAVEAFQAERKATGRWGRPKTAEMWRSRLRLLLQWFGGATPVSGLTREGMTQFFTALQRLPKNAAKLKELNGLTMRQLVEVEGFDRISASTVNLIMECVSGLFSWMEADRAKWGVSGNLAKGLTVSNAEGVERVAFTADDLRALLSEPEWKGRMFLHSYGFWLLPLGAYTGARLNELCQLDLADFSEVNGIPVVSLCTEGLRGKNKNARRMVPLHPELIRLGLLRHVDRLRQAGETRLFPECIEKRDGHGQDASRWFGKFKIRAGITDPRKVFHSLRHGFMSQLLDAGVDEKTGVAPLVGHAKGGEAVRTYWNEKDVRRLADIVKIVQYPVITELVPVVENVKFGVDVHRKNRRPPPRRKVSRRRRAL